MLDRYLKTIIPRGKLEGLILALNRWYFEGHEQTRETPTQIRDLTSSESKIADKFHDLYYTSWLNGRHTIDVNWLGHRALKCPLDLWIYQEILFETKPDLIIETGTNLGGSALYLASICQLLGHGRVVSIDTLRNPDLPQHPFIEYVTASSTDPETVRGIKERARGKSVMVILDSDHSREHVLAELEAYKDLVNVGNYLVVEDTNINGHPTRADFGPGPMEAVLEFLPKNPQFMVDRARERFIMTLNPNGFLKRVR